MSFTDVIKKSVLEGFAETDISTIKMLVTLSIVFLTALYIFFVYRAVTKNAFYSKSYAVSMAIISVITAAIILAMQSSIVISLGMVGALSIVRFRTAIKDPMDLLFLFWSIGVGIICGAGLYEVAVITSIVVTIGILVLDFLPVKKAPYLLILNSQDKGIEATVLPVVKENSSYYKIKSRNLTKDSIDMIIELKTSDEKQLMDKLGDIQTLDTISLLSHDGEVRG